MQIIAVLKREKELEQYNRLELISLVNWTQVQLHTGKLKIKNFGDFLRKQGIVHPLKKGKSKAKEIDVAYKKLNELLGPGLTDVFRRIQPKGKDRN